jgi:hypothetical protein
VLALGATTDLAGRSLFIEGVTRAKHLESSTRSSYIVADGTRHTQEIFRNTSLLPAIRNIVHDVPHCFSEAKRFRQGFQGCGLQISAKR